MLHAAGEQLLCEHVRLITASEPSEECIRHEGTDAVAIIARRPIRIGGEVMDALPSLSVLSATGSGADCFDVAAATTRGIPVLHNPGVAPGPVAEYVIAAIPMLLKRIVPADQFLRAGGDWEPKDRFRGDEAAGRTLGLVGFGHIARDVARRAQAGLDMHVVAYSRTTRAAEYEELGVEPCRTLDELLARADVVSINVPYSVDTKGMFDAAVIAKMRPGAILVNTARGGIVDDVALAAAVRAGRIGGAAVDVFEPEPPGPNHPLFGLTNVLVTPHIAGMTDEAMRRLSLSLARNLLKALEGDRPPHLVDPSVWPPRNTTNHDPDESSTRSVPA